MKGHSFLVVVRDKKSVEFRTTTTSIITSTYRNIGRHVTEKLIGVLVEFGRHGLAVLTDLVVEVIELPLQLGDQIACLIH